MYLYLKNYLLFIDIYIIIIIDIVIKKIKIE